MISFKAFPQDPLTPEEAGQLHTRITEIAYGKLQEWRANEYSLNQALNELYNDVFLNEFSNLSGFSSTEISDFMEVQMGLTQENIGAWDGYNINIGDTSRSALFEDIIEIVSGLPVPTAYLSQMQLLVTEYSDQIPAEELQTIVEISNSSYLYWFTNFNNWITAASPTSYGCQKDKVVGGDIRGAIGGFLASAWSGLGAIGGAVTGAMVGTLVGAVEAAFACK